MRDELFTFVMGLIGILIVATLGTAAILLFILLQGHFYKVFAVLVSLLFIYGIGTIIRSRID